jgi:hypothetical protein
MQVKRTLSTSNESFQNLECVADREIGLLLMTQ